MVGLHLAYNVIYSKVRKADWAKRFFVYLLTRGADPNEELSNGFPVIYWICSHMGHNREAVWSLATILVEHGAVMSDFEGIRPPCISKPELSHFFIAADKQSQKNS